MQNTRVREIMSSPVVMAAPDTRVPAAIALIKQHNIRHLPVVENERLVGIVSQGDLREASTSAAVNANSYETNFMLSRLTVGQIMTRRVFTVTPDAFVLHAAELIIDHKIAGLPVVDKDGSVVGMVTDSDLLRMLVSKLREQQGDGEPAAA